MVTHLPVKAPQLSTGDRNEVRVMSFDKFVTWSQGNVMDFGRLMFHVDDLIKDSF